MGFQHRDIMLLQAWFSPAFPIGAFSYSHGIETAIQENHIHDAESLQDWISFLLCHGTGWNDALCIKAAYHNAPEINDLCLALASSKERYQEALELGQAFTKAMQASYDVELPTGLAYPVAVGMSAYQKGIDLQLTIQSYLQAFAANLISVGVRIIPIGQQAGQNCLVGLYPTVETITQKILNAEIDQLGNASFMSDLMAMKHENAIPRIYRT